MKQNILTESIRYENKYGNWWYEHDICIEDCCNVLINSCDNSYSAGRQVHPRGPKRIVRCLDHFKEDTKERHLISNPRTNKVSKIAYGIAGGQKTFYEKSRDERFLIRQEATKIYLLNEKPAEEVLEFMSEFGQSKPMTKRIISKIEGEKVPEGWVYIVRNPDVPDILKIGKTFPDGIASIMSDARRFGRAELVAKYKFKEAYKAEQSIHKRLAKYNLRVLGYTDCGKELFKCDEIVAIPAILSEGPVLDDSYNNLTLPHSTQAGLEDAA